MRAQRSWCRNLIAGGRIALVSDAGTPGVSDPGAWLAREAIAAGVPVFPIPGANAAISALIASGLPSAEFQFLGFLPEKAGARRTSLEKLAAEPRESARTLIFYEAPHRILDTLADLEAVFGPRVARGRCARADQDPRGVCARHGRRRSPASLPAAIASAARSRCWWKRRQHPRIPAARQALELRTRKIADRVARIQAESGHRREGSAEAPGARAGPVKKRTLPRTAARARQETVRRGLRGCETTAGDFRRTSRRLRVYEKRCSGANDSRKRNVLALSRRDSGADSGIRLPTLKRGANKLCAYGGPSGPSVCRGRYGSAGSRGAYACSTSTRVE